MSRCLHLYRLIFLIAFFYKLVGDLSTIVGRPVEVLAIEYSTRSDKLSTEVENLYLVHLTEHLLSNMYARTFESDEMIHFEGMDVRHYKSISPRLIQFQVTTLFQQTEGALVPSSEQVIDIVKQGLTKSGDFYSEYLTTLEQMPFEVFSTTISFRVITDAAELQRSTEENYTEDDKPKTILVVAVVIVCLSIFICAFAWFRGAKTAKGKPFESYDMCGISQATFGFRTATFDDQIADDGCVVEEANVEKTDMKGLEEVNLNDGDSDCKSAQESDWSSDAESFTMIFKDYSSDAGSECRHPATERSLESCSSTLETTNCKEGKSVWAENQCVPFPRTQSIDGKVPGVLPVANETSAPEGSTAADRITSYTEAKSRKTNVNVPIWMKKRQEVMQQREQQAVLVEVEKSSVESVASQPAWSASSLSVLKETNTPISLAHHELYQAEFACPNSVKTEAKRNTLNKHVPVWMIKRQEIMQQREQQGKPVELRSTCSVRTNATVELLPPLGDESSPVEFSVSDVSTEKEASDPVCHGKCDVGPDEPTNETSMRLSASDETVTHVEIELVAKEPIAVPSMILSPSDISIVDEKTDEVNPANGKLAFGTQTPDAQFTSIGLLVSDDSNKNEKNDPISAVHEKRTFDQPALSRVGDIAVTKDQRPSKIGDENIAGKDLPLWMRKRQEIMQQSEEQNEHHVVEAACSSSLFKEKTTGRVSSGHSELGPDQPESALSNSTNATLDQKSIGTEGSYVAKHLPLWLRKRHESMQQSDLQSPQNEAESTSSMSLLRKGTMGLVSSGHSELVPDHQESARVDNTNATKYRNSSKTDGDSIKHLPIWMRTQQESMLQSAQQSLQDETETPATEPASFPSPLIKEETNAPASPEHSDMSPIESTSAQLENMNATPDQNESTIKEELETNDNYVPLWMRKRQEIVQQSEEEEEHLREDQLDSPASAPVWMTRFKQMDKD